MRKASVLLIYTGGTIGMRQDPLDQTLKPFDFSQILEEVPELRKFALRIDVHTFSPLIDSSDVEPGLWQALAELIQEKYEAYDGFVVLHGTDTMAYTASALSFMFKNLAKPIVLTGSQLPLGMLRSDGRENIICALEIASTRLVTIPEVCIFFDSHLYRGNRSTKINAENFDAFESYNYPSLAKAGINFSFKERLFLPMPTEPLQVRKRFDTRVAVLKLFPGIGPEVVNAVLRTPGLQGVVVETYGSGNAPTDEWFISALEEAIRRGIVVLNVTQCKAGSVKMRQYAASCDMDRVGVIGAGDITIEAAVAKMMCLLGEYPDDKEHVKLRLSQSLRGEITEQ